MNISKFDLNVTEFLSIQFSEKKIIKKGNYYIGRFRSWGTISLPIVSYEDAIFSANLPTLLLANILSQRED